MRELADNLLDIAQNSIAAKATLVTIKIQIISSEDIIKMSFIDNGSGMSRELLQKVEDPFVTTRNTRRVGMGIPLFKQTALMTGGSFSISSTAGKGTIIEASLGLSHLDRPPLGDLAGTLLTLTLLNEDVDFVFIYLIDGREFSFDTREIKSIVAPLKLSDMNITAWLREYLKESIITLHGGVSIL